MSRLRANTFEWVSFGSGVLGFVLLFFPGARSFFERSGLLGWGLLLLVLLAVPVVTTHVNGKRGEAEAARDEAYVERDAAQGALANLRSARSRLSADYALVVERLGDWTMDGDFFTYLYEDVNFTHLRFSYIRSITEKCDAWERDSRRIADADLQELFAAIEAAARAHGGHLGDYLWMLPTQSREPKDWYSSIPSEWELQMPGRFQAALRDLRASRTDLITSLQATFAHLHEVKSELRLGSDAGRSSGA